MAEWAEPNGLKARQEHSQEPSQEQGRAGQGRVGQPN